MSFSRLDPKDYYCVRFVKPADPDTGVTVGYEGVVIEHLPPVGGRIGCVVEVGPCDEQGEPLVIVTVSEDCVERIQRTLERDERQRINQRWEDMEKWVALRQQSRRPAQPAPKGE